MSLRRHVLRLVVLATAVAVCFSAFAGAASAKKYSAKQKAQIRKSLKKQIKKNPGVIKRKSFVRKAALVNFVLPVTIRLRTMCPGGTTGQANCVGAPTNGTALNQGGGSGSTTLNAVPNAWDNAPVANVDLGPSLGQRQIALSGALSGEVQFNDSYDGGALGNVAIKILPTINTSTKKLRTSSVPLLWNPDVSGNSTRSDVNFARAATNAGSSIAPAIGSVANSTQGCSDFTNAANASRNLFGLPTGPGGGRYNALFYGTTFPGSLAVTGGLPGYPVIDPTGPGTQLSPSLFLPVYPGIDDWNNIQGGSFTTGNNNLVGPTQNPFPQGNNTAPGSANYNAANTVLRTNALELGIAAPGVTVDGATGTSAPAGPTGLTNGPQGTQSIVTGQSGGQANLFGNIPGKSDSIDVTVNLQTTINSIIRIVDQDVFDTPLLANQSWPAGIFNCRQVVTGAIQNYIPGVRLKGSLRIAPAITKDGKLRIAKATVSTSQATHVALSACLMPYKSFGLAATTSYPTTTTNRGVFGGGIPTQGSSGPSTPSPAIPTLNQATTLGPMAPGAYGAGGLIAADNGAIPIQNVADPVDPSNVPCNAAPTELIRNSGLTGSVEAQSGINNLAEGYNTTANGSAATVAGDITVPNLDVDVLIGNN